MRRAIETYFSSNVLASSHVITGKFLRSLYVGRSTEYLSLDFVGAILRIGNWCQRSV